MGNLVTKAVENPAEIVHRVEVLIHPIDTVTGVETVLRTMLKEITPTLIHPIDIVTGVETVVKEITPAPTLIHPIDTVTGVETVV